MPELPNIVKDDLIQRLGDYLVHRGGHGVPVYLAAGGSAAVYRVDGPDGPRAFKVFDAKFFDGPSGEAERRRLEVQRRLIGHECPYLIQTHRVEEFGGTAFMEMEFIEWPSLKNALAFIPDEKVSELIKQLVKAAQFLEEHGIVHRDIKPENIHISPDFSSIKLLDLGVARDIEAPDGIDATITDHGDKRPFLATAQYSSPEYLFRLDEPNAKLWKGLNFYQIGAVLHDLIMKVPLFNQEVSMDNKWLVTKAVLVKSPSFVDGMPGRLASMKALAARCLVKDLDSRLQLVNWQDFYIPEANTPQSLLRGKLERRKGTGVANQLESEQKLLLERTNQWKQLTDKIRDDLISLCRNNVPSSLTEKNSTDASKFCYLSFSLDKEVLVTCALQISWGGGYQRREAQIKMAACVHGAAEPQAISEINPRLICALSLDAGLDEASLNIVDKISTVLAEGIDYIDANGENDSLKSHVLFSKIDE